MGLFCSIFELLRNKNNIFFCYFRVKGYLTQKQHVEHYVLNLHIRTEIKKKGYLNRP